MTRGTAPPAPTPAPGTGYESTVAVQQQGMILTGYDLAGNDANTAEPPTLNPKPQTLAALNCTPGCINFNPQTMDSKNKTHKNQRYTINPDIKLGDAARDEPARLHRVLTRLGFLNPQLLTPRPKE